MENEPEHRALNLSEKIADGSVHVIGLTGALVGAVLLAVWPYDQMSTGQSLGLAVYGLALIATFAASAVYNMNPWERVRPALRRIDHAAIYVKIAGTYTPLVIMIGSLSAYIVLLAVWILAGFGVIRKLFFWQNPGRLGAVLYLVMGWLSVLLIWPMIKVLPASAVWLIAIGGVIYSSGVIFYVQKNLKFSKAIWHVFVVAASVCFYIAIVTGLLAHFQ